jgi:hypothetical protein
MVETDGRHEHMDRQLGERRQAAHTLAVPDAYAAKAPGDFSSGGGDRSQQAEGQTDRQTDRRLPISIATPSLARSRRHGCPSACPSLDHNSAC